MGFLAGCWLNYTPKVMQHLRKGATDATDRLTNVSCCRLPLRKLQQF